MNSSMVSIVFPECGVKCSSRSLLDIQCESPSAELRLLSGETSLSQTGLSISVRERIVFGELLLLMGQLRKLNSVLSIGMITSALTDGDNQMCLVLKCIVRSISESNSFPQITQLCLEMLFTNKMSSLSEGNWIKSSLCDSLALSGVEVACKQIESLLVQGNGLVLESMRSSESCRHPGVKQCRYLSYMRSSSLSLDQSGSPVNPMRCRSL